MGQRRFSTRIKKIIPLGRTHTLKLIYRETNISTYQIVKDLKGGLHAFFWQGMAKLYDNNLKTPYQPESVEEDQWIEYIIVDAKKKGIIE